MSQRVLTFHYTLTNASGDVLDSSRNAQPFSVIEGARQIIPALEEELFKMSVGDKNKIEIPAAKAYGIVNDSLKITISKNQLPEGTPIEVGMQLQPDQNPGSPVFVATKIEDDKIHLDGNHPLAGVDLTFDIEVTEIREATEKEMSGGDDCCSGGTCSQES